MSKTIKLNENQFKNFVTNVTKYVLNETTRRQKAISAFLGKRNSVKTFGIITAENPMGIELTSQENRSRNNMLKSFLQERQYLYFPVKGKYGENKENPFLIYNVSLGDMKAIGRTFNQESFIFAEIVNDNNETKVVFSYYQKPYSEEMKYDDTGKKIKAKDREYQFIESKDVFLRFDDDKDDLFTAIGRHFKFSIPFEIFNEQVNRINQMILERSRKYENYRASCNRLIEESISDKRTSFSRQIRRAQLYGKNYENFWKKR